MSFGPSQQAKTAMSSTADISKTATGNAATATGAGENLLNMGGANTGAGTNYFKAMMGGNAGETSAMLQPDIDRIRQAQQGNMQALSTMMPRGGGRAGTLFSSAYAPNQQIQSLFNMVRPQAASTLAQTGLQQTGQGANLFGIGGQLLGTGANANRNISDFDLQNRELTNKLWSGLGSGIFGLATMPMGGGGGTLGKLFNNLFKTPINLKSGPNPAWGG